MKLTQVRELYQWVESWPALFGRWYVRKSLLGRAAVFSVSLLGTCWVYAWYFKSWQEALVILGSMLLPEFVRFGVIRHYGEGCSVVFFPPLGPGAFCHRPNIWATISYSRLLRISVAKPVTNTALVLLGLAGLTLDGHTRAWHDLAVLNVAMMSFALLPHWYFDGGKILHAVFHCRENHPAPQIKRIALGLAVVTVGVIVIKAGIAPFAVFALILAAGLGGHHDGDFRHHHRPAPRRLKHVYSSVVLYFALEASALVMSQFYQFHVRTPW